MADKRRKDVEWLLPEPGQNVSFEAAQLAVLMDIRDELKRINGILHYSNFLEIPGILRKIRANTNKPRAPKK